MPRLLHHQPDNMPTARRPIQSKPDPRRPADSPAPKCQANSPPVTPRLTRRPASVLNTPNCAKMANLRPLLGLGGGTGGIRWGDGGGTAREKGGCGDIKASIKCAILAHHLFCQSEIATLLASLLSLGAGS